MYIYIYTSLQHIICGWFPLVLPGAARATERIPCFFRAWARIDLAPCVGFVAVSTAVVFLTVFKSWDGWLERVGTQCFHTHTYVHIHMHIPAYTWTYIYIYIYTYNCILYIHIIICILCYCNRMFADSYFQNGPTERELCRIPRIKGLQHTLPPLDHGSMYCGFPDDYDTFQ